jgi:hypothetical protein
MGEPATRVVAVLRLILAMGEPATRVVTVMEEIGTPEEKITVRAPNNNSSSASW